MTRKKKSLFDLALGGGRRKRSRGGLADVHLGRKPKKARSRGLAGAFEVASRKQRKGRELSDYLNFSDSKKRRRRREWKVVRDVATTLTRRLTRTERLEAQEAAERVLQQDTRLGQHVRDEALTGNESFVRRLVRLVRERVGQYASGK
jgi:hypothetical protein